jgi:PKHD-type hydroxylase
VAWLSSELRLALLAMLPAVHWRDGKTTAFGAAAAAKTCEVADFGPSQEAFITQEGAELYAKVFRAIVEHPGFVANALPRRLGALRLMRYGLGGEYGSHVDQAMSERFRCDLSFTVLLQAADAGGELVVSGEQIQLLEGDVYLYPSTQVHGVTRVGSGERIVLVGWVESMVRDHDKRALISKLHAMVENPEERQAVSIQSVREELLRRWGG